MTDIATTGALLEAIRADVRTRVDSIVDRLEVQVEELDQPAHLEEALREALVEVTGVLAEGIVAHLREKRLSRRNDAADAAS